MFEQDPFGKAFDVAAQVTGGICPTCTHKTVFVSLSPEIYRCMSCGTDCKQYVNGQIRYLPAVTSLSEETKHGETTKVRG